SIPAPTQTKTPAPLTKSTASIPAPTQTKTPAPLTKSTASTQQIPPKSRLSEEKLGEEQVNIKLALLLEDAKDTKGEVLSKIWDSELDIDTKRELLSGATLAKSRYRNNNTSLRESINALREVFGIPSINITAPAPAPTQTKTPAPLTQKKATLRTLERSMSQ
ncbi:MAG: hypothetical protein LBT02_01160, partial [Rickettsiales bacterium]|nr:hypothetical protein [Rickettsiales bacterium]